MKACEDVPKRRVSLPRVEQSTLFQPDSGGHGAPSSAVCSTAMANGFALVRIYLVDRSRKRTMVLDYDDAIQIPETKTSMDLELATYKQFDVYEEVSLTSLHPIESCICTKWVLSIKTSEDDSKRHKARLVGRSFEDAEKEFISRDSPTASNATQRLILQLLAERHWVPHS